MARIARLIIYDAEVPEIVHQMSQSLSEGIHDKGNVKITVINFTSNIILDEYVDQASKELDEVEQEENLTVIDHHPV